MEDKRTITDIFIKTYYKDFIWLRYCLLSIKKFASGFSKVVIVCDKDDDHPIPDDIYNILPINVFYVNLPIAQPTHINHGLGYLWQQYIKLTWYNYSNADEVLILDSDEMLTTITYPINFKINNKYNWFLKDWKFMGDGKCWKGSTDKLMINDTKYSGMCITGFILQKETSIALKNFLCSSHNTNDIWDIFIKYNMPTCSEYNIFGNFIYLHDRSEYNITIMDDSKQYFNHTIQKYWSWGGLNDLIIKQNNDILNKNI